MDPLGPVVITAREIYDQGARTAELVKSVAVTLTNLQQDLSEHQQAQGKINSDVEARLRSLEKARWPLPALAVLVSLAALAMPLLTHIH